MYGSPAIISTRESDLWASKGKLVWVKRKYCTKRSYCGGGTRTNCLSPPHATPRVLEQGSSQAFLGWPDTLTDHPGDERIIVGSKLTATSAYQNHQEFIALLQAVVILP